MKAPLLFAAALSLLEPVAPAQAAPPAVKVALSRNLVTSGLWDRVTEGFTQSTGFAVDVVLAGEREDAATALQEGRASVICIHDSGTDLTAELLRKRAASTAQPWISSELVIVGPRSDPAIIRGLTDGGEALRRIVATGSPCLDSHGAGSRETTQKLWQIAGVEPKAEHLIPLQRGTDKAAALRVAADHGAYWVTGRSTALPAMLAALEGKLDLLVQGDVKMRRVFYLVQAKPAAENSSALIRYLLSNEVMESVKGFASERTEGQALFAPARKP